MTKKTHLDQKDRVFAEDAPHLLGAQPVRERNVLFHVGNLQVVRLRTGRSTIIEPLPLLAFLFLFLLLFCGVIVEVGASVISLRGTGALVGDAVRVVVRDAQDVAVADDAEFAECVHAAYFVQAGAASERVRHRRQHRVSGAPRIPGYRDDRGLGCCRAVS